MRDNRTKDEMWTIKELLSYLLIQKETWIEDNRFTDKPDLVIENSEGYRVACELSTVGINELYQWKNDQTKHLDFDELDSFILAREPNEWLKKVIKQKNSKIATYEQQSTSSETWLIVHSSEMKPYDVFVLDKEYDLPLLQNTAKNLKHDFSRIYIVSSTAGIAKVFPVDDFINPAFKLNMKIMKQLEIRTIGKNTLHSNGVTTFKLGQEFTPDRINKLEPLGHYK